MEKIKKRVYEEAVFMCQNNSTIRTVANKFNVSKTTTHIDLTVRLKELDKLLYYKVQAIMKYNISMRHIRGGEATKRKYKKSVPL